MPRSSFRWRPRQALVWWTSGKDSAWALSMVQQDPSWDVLGLLTPVNERNGRVLLHGVRDDLLQAQAAAVGLPLQAVPIVWTGSEKDREAPFGQALSAARAEGVEFVICGDLSSDIRRERRSMVIGGAGLEAVFPLWGRDSRAHADELLDAGLSSLVCTVETSYLASGLAGRSYDEEFVANLPDRVDPTGEHDEFHTFVEWAPGWNRRVPVGAGRRIEVYDFALAEVESVDLSEDDPRDAEAAGEMLPTGADPFSYFERLARVRRYVDACIADHLDLDAVADVAAMSPTGFSRYFREHTGTTFAVWLARRRVEHACRLLSEDNAAIGRIGEAVGFHSERTFRRAFHDHMDRSPSEYRRELLERPVGAEPSDSAGVSN